MLEEELHLEHSQRHGRHSTVGIGLSTGEISVMPLNICKNKRGYGTAYMASVRAYFIVIYIY